MTPGAPPIHLNLHALAFGMFIGIPLTMVLAIAIYPRFRSIPLAALFAFFGYVFRAKGGVQPRVWLWSPRSVWGYLDSTPLPLALLAGALLTALLIPLIRIGRRASADVPRELCQRCGYARASLSTCPECGASNPAPLPQQRTS